MPLVIDSSVTMAWCFRDEADDLTRSVVRRVAGDGAVVPAVWPFEVANTLIVGIRRGRIDVEQAHHFVERLRALPIVTEPGDRDQTLGPVFRLASAQALTAYDAAYLDLALRTGLPLATRDGQLRDAAGRLGIVLAG